MERAYTTPVNKILEIGLIVLAVIAVAGADVLAKKIGAASTRFMDDLRNPLLLAVLGLYAIQILIFIYVFGHKAGLGAVGVIETALYAVIVIGSSVLFFDETISLVQGIGIGLALVGVILINF